MYVTTMGHCNLELVSANVIHADGDFSTLVAFSVEQRRLVRAGSYPGRAYIYYGFFFPPCVNVIVPGTLRITDT